MKPYISSAVSAFVVVAPISNAFAQELANSEDKKREEITVTAVPISDILQPTQVMSGDELLLKTAPTLGETLSNELGVSSTYFGPAASRPIIRGLSGSRVTMLTDSAASLDVSDVSPDHAVTVEPILADQIEVIRGPATLLYGSTAAGGIVNVVDSRIPKAPAEQVVSGAVEIRGDTAAEGRAVVGRLDGGFGAFAWHVDGFTRDTENIEISGYATADPGERPPEERPGELPNSYSDTDGVAAGVSWVSERGYLGASISTYQSIYGLPGPAEEEEGEGEEEPEIYEGPFLDMEQTRIDVRGEYAFDGSALESARFVLGANNYEHKEVEPSGEVATTFDNDQWQLRLESKHRPLGLLAGVFGIQLDHRDFAAVGEEAFITPTESEAIGLFLLEEADFDWGQILLGIRAEDLEHKNADLPKYSDTAWSFSVGTIVDIAFDSEIIVNLALTQRNPNTEELYSDGAHIATRQYEIGLLVDGGSATTEDSANIELGWRRTAGVVTWDASVYYYDFKNYIYQDLTGQEEDGFPEAVYTQDDANLVGGEAGITFPLWSRTALDNNLRVFGDVVKAELDNGDKLPRIPPWRAGANLDFGTQNWTTGLDVIYYAKQDDISSFNTDAYTMVNVNFLYKLKTGSTEWDLYLRGTNLTDEEARKSTSVIGAYAPLPGRSLHIGTRLAF